MTKKYCEDMIKELTTYWNMASNAIDRNEINEKNKEI